MVARGFGMSLTDAEKQKRQANVKFIFDQLPPFQVVRSLQKADYLPLVSLYASLNRYIEGSIDCIIHAAFSVEMALILKLDSILTDQEKAQVRRENAENGLMFGKIIGMANKRSILDKHEIGKAWRLNHLRNMTAHPANWVVFIKQQYKAALNVEQGMPEINALISQKTKALEFSEDKQVVAEKCKLMYQVVSGYVKRLDNIPNLEWCAGQDTLKFQTERVKEYYKESYDRVLTSEGMKELLNNYTDSVTYLQTNYSYAGRDEFEALYLAYDILKKLNLIT